MPSTIDTSFDSLLFSMDGIEFYPEEIYGAINNNIASLNLLDLCKAIVDIRPEQSIVRKTKNHLKRVFARIFRNQNYHFNRNDDLKLLVTDEEFYANFPRQQRVKTLHVYYYTDIDPENEAEKAELENAIFSIATENNLTILLDNSVDLHHGQAIYKNSFVSRDYAYFDTERNTIPHNGKTKLYIQIYSWKNKNGFGRYISRGQRGDSHAFVFGPNVPARFKSKVDLTIRNAQSITNNPVTQILDSEPGPRFQNLEFDSLYSVTHIGNSFRIALDSPNTRVIRFNNAFRYIQTKILDAIQLPNTIEYSPEVRERIFLFVISCSMFAPILQEDEGILRGHLDTIREVCIVESQQLAHSKVASKIAYMVAQTINRHLGLPLLPTIEIHNLLLGTFTNEYTRETIDQTNVSAFYDFVQGLSENCERSDVVRAEIVNLIQAVSQKISELQCIPADQKASVAHEIAGLYWATIQSPRSNNRYVQLPTCVTQNVNFICAELFKEMLRTQNNVYAMFLHTIIQALRKYHNLSPIVSINALKHMCLADFSVLTF